MKKKRIFIAGDSTACIYKHCGSENKFPCTGWGQVVDRFIPEHHIIDLALSGASSSSFKTEDNYRHLKEALSPGDCFIIQFGHNDSQKEDPSRYCDAKTEYKESLMEYVRLARSRGAAPILATPISRNRFADPVLEEYAESVRELAQSEVIPLMDFYEAMSAYINSAGCAAASDLFMNINRHDERFIDDPRFKGSRYYDVYTQDNTHLNINGALFTAEFAADMLHELFG